MNGAGRKIGSQRQGPLHATAGKALVLALTLLAGCRSGENVGGTVLPPDLGGPPAAWQAPAPGGPGTAAARWTGYPVPAPAVFSSGGQGGPYQPAAAATGAPASAGVVQTRYAPAPVAQANAAPKGPDGGPTVVLPELQPPPATSPIDLPSALRLAGADNPTIALADEAVRASLAEQLRARTLLLPDLSAGFNYDLHYGTLQGAKGIIRDLNRQALYVGAGASAVVAGTVNVPGVRISAPLAEAVLEPRVARERVAGRRFDAIATRHNLLLEVAVRFLDLEGAQARLLALRQSEAEFQTLADITKNFARIGQGRLSDAERARTQLLLLRADMERLTGDIEVQSAELARLLNLDPSYRPRAAGGLPALLQLVDPSDGLDKLLPIALANRPEIGARTMDVAVNETRLRKEQIRPFVPFISVGFSAGGFGGGSDLVDTRFGHFGSRVDFDALAVWSFQNLGLGNLAMQREVRAEVREAMAERTRTVDLVRREVAEAYALTRQRRAEVEIARKRIETSREAYRLDLIRVRNNQGLPLEVINSARLLNAARQDFIGASVAFNQAQFQLLVALGNPPG